MITKSIERAQKKIEAMNFSSRKNIIEYDDVMNYQREVVYNRRNFSLHEEDISIELNHIIEEYVDDLIEEYCSDNNSDNWNFDVFKTEILNTFSLELKDSSQINNTDMLRDAIMKGTLQIVSFKKD